MLNPSYPGGLSANHPSVELFPILVAPSTGNEKNRIRMELIPVACWKLNDVRFAFGSSFVLPDSRSEFFDLSALRQQHPAAPLSVFGHADPVGNDTFNKALSGHRAESIYAVLSRNLALWEKLYSTIGSSEGWGQPAIQTMVNALGHPTVKDFQSHHELNVDGVAGPITRSKLFLAYMDFLCPVTFAKSDFLSGGLDPQGKGDYQGCGEFNPAMVFSQSEFADRQQPAQKSQRDLDNGVNRRVMVLLFRPGSSVSPEKWPCPRSGEGVDGCHRRFWSDGELRRAPQTGRREFPQTKDTFACRFYHRLVINSPCEGIQPPLEEVGPLLEQVAPTQPQQSTLVSKGPAPAVSNDVALAGPDFGFVMVRKNKFVARQIFRLRVDKPFDGVGTFTISTPNKIDFFIPGGDGKTPMNFTGENVFSGADLAKPEGVLLFAEGKTPSQRKDDIILTLTLSGGGKKLKAPATMKVSSVELSLGIANAPLPGQPVKPIPMPNKQTVGARVFVQSTRAVLIVGQPKPFDINHELTLSTLSGRVELFAKATASKGETPLAGVLKIKSGSILPAGQQFFIEGRFPSKNVADETYELGIGTSVMGTLANDSVALTVVDQSWTGKIFYSRTWNHDTGADIPAVQEFLPFNKVELHGKAPGSSKDVLIFSSTLEEDGKFEFLNVPELASAFIRILLEHKDSKVVRVRGQVLKGSSTPVNLPNFKIKAGLTVSFDQPVAPALFTGKTGSIDFGDFEALQPRFAMYCDAYKSVWFGHTKLLELTEGTADAPLCIINVPQPTDSTSFVQSGEMFLLESDVQDIDVILHEYGHFVGEKFVGGLGSLGYTFNDEPEPASHGSLSQPFGSEHYEAAWDEAYATFLSCAFRSKSTYKDSHEDPKKLDPAKGLHQDLNQVETTFGAHNEAGIQQALFQIHTVHKINFKAGFWTALTSLPKVVDAYSFFDNWKAKGCPDVPKVIQAYASRAMDFGYRYPAGADMFTCVAAPGGFNATTKQFSTVAELFTAFGSVPGDSTATADQYDVEFYNRNRVLNSAALGPGSAAKFNKTTKVLTITIKLVPGQTYIVPRRFQITA